MTCRNRRRRRGRVPRRASSDERQALGRRSSTSTRWSPTTSRTRPRPSEGSRVMCRYGEHGEIESMLARALRRRRAARRRGARRSAASAAWGVDRDALAAAMPFVAEHRAPAFLEALADQCVKHGTGPTHLSDDFELVAETFRRFADDKIRPGRRARAPHQRRRARGHHHRPRRARRLRALGARGVRRLRDRRRVRLHGHGRRDRGAVARARSASAARSSPGPRSSPARSSRAAPKSRSRRWLPRIASGELMVGIMVTEPDYGSDVAGVKVARDADRRRLASSTA